MKEEREDYDEEKPPWLVEDFDISEVESLDDMTKVALAQSYDDFLRSIANLDRSMTRRTNKYDPKLYWDVRSSLIHWYGLAKACRVFNDVEYIEKFLYEDKTFNYEELKEVKTLKAKERRNSKKKFQEITYVEIKDEDVERFKAVQKISRILITDMYESNVLNILKNENATASILQ